MNSGLVNLIVTSEHDTALNQRFLKESFSPVVDKVATSIAYYAWYTRVCEISKGASINGAQANLVQ